VLGNLAAAKVKENENFGSSDTFKLQLAYLDVRFFLHNELK
jgi:hypothetical protein